VRQTPALTWNVTGQQLDLRFALGRPTSAAFAVFRAYMDDDATPEFSGSAVLDTVNTTSSAIAGPTQTDPQNISLGSVAGILATRKYLLAGGGAQAWIAPVQIGTSNVRHRHVLETDFASGSTFQSTYLTAAVDNAWILDRSKLSDLSDTYPDYRVKWTVVYAGATYVVYSFFDVLRSPTFHSVDIDDINTRAPGLEDSMPVEYRIEDGRPLIDSAYRSVRAHLQALGVDLNILRSNESIDELVILRSLRQLAEGGWSPPGMDKQLYLQTTTSNYDRFFEQHYQTSLKDRVDYQFGILQRNMEIPARGIWEK
jgi:hypothetical protein